MRLVLIALAVVTGAGPAARVWTFGKDDAGKKPAGWTAAKTGEGEGSVWQVRADESAPGKTGHALVQTAAGPPRLFNLCLVDGTAFRDGELSVRVKAVGGDVDQGGGLLWRAKDANNYYVCRYNPLEKNFRLYHVKAGQRKELAGKNKVETPAGQWFTVAVTHVGDRIRCTLNGEHALDVTDGTFPEAGQVGLWTKADAVTAFDVLRVGPAGK